MASFGERPKVATAAMGDVSKKSCFEQAKTFCEAVQGIDTVCSKNLFSEPVVALSDPRVQKSLKDYFVESMIESKKSLSHEAIGPQELVEMREDYGNLFENDIMALKESAVKMLNEHTAVAAINPAIGFSLPMHINLLMNTAFCNGTIPRGTANSFSFNRTMKIRYLIDPETGKRYDIYKDQNKLTQVMLNSHPELEVDVALPEMYTTDFIEKLNGIAGHDHLDRTTRVVGFCVEHAYIKAGNVLPSAATSSSDLKRGGWANEGLVAESDTAVDELWYHCNIKFNFGLGEIKRQLQDLIPAFSYTEKIGEGSETTVTIPENTYIAGNIIDDKISIMVASPKITKVRLAVKLDASARTMSRPTVDWGEFTTNVEIGTDNGISATISPETTMDIAVGYNINQATELMEIMKIVMLNRRDDIARMRLDESYQQLDPRSKFYAKFDFAPIDSYNGDPVTWRHAAFFDYLEDYTQKMMEVLNDPNMTFSIFCDPTLVTKLGKNDVVFDSNGKAGAVKIDFTKTVYSTASNKVYQFVGSDKLRHNNQMIIILCPTNGNDRVTYQIYDYQAYASNEIRDDAHPALPQITMFDRWLLDWYQPVQGRLDIVNPLGYKPSHNSATTIPGNLEGTL